MARRQVCRERRHPDETALDFSLKQIEMRQHVHVSRSLDDSRRARGGFPFDWRGGTDTACILGISLIPCVDVSRIIMKP